MPNKNSNLDAIVITFFSQNKQKGITMDYKNKEIKEFFDDFINDQDPAWIKENMDDLHHHAFKTVDYIIGTYQAKKWLGDMAFDVINFIKEYEEFHFGKVNTDFSSPEKIVNRYADIIGGEIVNDYLCELEKAA